MLSALFRVAYDRINRKIRKNEMELEGRNKKNSLTNKQETNELLHNNVMIKL